MSTPTNTNLDVELEKIRQDFLRAVDMHMETYNKGVKELFKKIDQRKLTELRKKLNS